MQDEKNNLHLRLRRSMVRLIPLLKRGLFVSQIAENRRLTGRNFCDLPVLLFAGYAHETCGMRARRKPGMDLSAGLWYDMERQKRSRQEDAAGCLKGKNGGDFDGHYMAGTCLLSDSGRRV